MKKYIIIDIDGTIADCTHRLHFLDKAPKNWNGFYKECISDKPIKGIIDIIETIQHEYNVILCTGRSERVRAETVWWLDKYCYDLTYEILLMRSEGDHRPDYKAKPELIEQFGIKLYDIAFVLEDRDSMVRVWRDRGVKCLQVADGNF